ncbi:uncharacterized protein LOC116615986 [Nematostella vectensis]|uniref:uncharacterized protein LOC116615986 n=1 Tax=Nematostella vectensis TaxID=45351 RepID=UPI0013903C6B|nr:uncharacterized protein LOC116615986 [Nematostella vectensis]
MAKTRFFALRYLVFSSVLIIGTVTVLLFTRSSNKKTTLSSENHWNVVANRTWLYLGETIKPTEKKDLRNKNFLYLVQAESCLPLHLLKANLLGNGDDRDAMVLTWKSECRQRQGESLSHISYIFDKNQTWGSGRNLLFQRGLKRRNTYLYYIFLDEDIEFSFTENVTKRDIYNSTSPLTSFENFLKGLEPAVGLANFCSRCGRFLPDSSYVASSCCSPRPINGILPSVLPVSITFDAAFNAFHRNAVKYLLPYKLNYENTSWWESQKYIILASDVLFRGRVLRYNTVTALNTIHRNYPKQQYNNWKEILMGIKTSMPTKFHNLSVFQEDPVPQLPFNVSGNVMFTPRWNVSMKMVKLPIQPLAHFRSVQRDQNSVF